VPHPPRVLPVAYALVSALVVLNWLYGAVVTAILIGLFASPHWTMSALGVSSAAQTPSFLTGMRVIAALGLLAIPLNLALLRRLIAMIETVRGGDPFIAANAYRLQAMAWILVGQQLLSIAVGLAGRAISTPEHQLHLNAGFSPSAWLAVVIAFVLARVFAAGTLMREDLEGTV
jgi:hypothetical protein